MSVAVLVNVVRHGPGVGHVLLAAAVDEGATQVA